MPDIRIAIVDDHDLFREGIRSIFERTSDFNVVLDASNGKVFLEELATIADPPHIVLMDLNMPELNGIQTTREILQHYPGIRVVALTMHNEERYILRMMELGASGYLQKSAKPKEVEHCLKQVYQQGYFFDGDLAKIMQKGLMNREKLSDSVGIPIHLSERELDVLRLICCEKTTKEIADELCLSARTVEGHRKNLIGKTGVRSVAGLVVFGFKHHLVDPME